MPNDPDTDLAHELSGESAGSLAAEEIGSIDILVVDDDASILESCESVLSAEGYGVEVERRGADAIRRLKSGKYQILLVDQRMPEVDGMKVLTEMRSVAPDTLAIMMTGYATTEASVQALQSGAWDYLPKPFTATQLLVMVGRAAVRVTRMRSVTERSGKDGLLWDGTVRILGRSRVMRDVVKRALKVAGTDASVFITGGSGTGKELIARFIHEESRRASKPFVAVNCAALPGELLESEMFGHRRGAFTGAVRDKPGLLEMADRGTFFLDELAEMPIELQPKLLRVLQDGVVRRVGSETKDAVVDIRFVSATNRDPADALERGLLRHDLYYRLRVVPIDLPPLRERTEDIPVLVRHFVDEFWRRHQLEGDAPPEVTEPAMEQLIAYAWPGNVRELQNVIEQLVVLAEPDAPIDVDDLTVLEGGAEISGTHHGSGDGENLLSGLDLAQPYHKVKDDLMGRFERQYLASVIRRANGNMSKAARQAGIDRSTLYRLLEKHDLNKEHLAS